jgi:hypothetical protein
MSCITENLLIKSEQKNLHQKITLVFWCVKVESNRKCNVSNRKCNVSNVIGHLFFQSVTERDFFE